MCSMLNSFVFIKKGLGPYELKKVRKRKVKPFSSMKNSSKDSMEDTMPSDGIMVEISGYSYLEEVPRSYLPIVDPRLAGISLMPDRSEGIDPPSTQHGFCFLLIGGANQWEQASWVNYDRDNSAQWLSDSDIGHFVGCGR